MSPMFVLAHQKKFKKEEAKLTPSPGSLDVSDLRLHPAQFCLWRPHFGEGLPFCFFLLFFIFFQKCF